MRTGPGPKRRVALKLLSNERCGHSDAIFGGLPANSIETRGNREIVLSNPLLILGRRISAAPGNHCRVRLLETRFEFWLGEGS